MNRSSGLVLLAPYRQVTSRSRTQYGFLRRSPPVSSPSVSRRNFDSRLRRFGHHLHTRNICQWIWTASFLLQLHSAVDGLRDSLFNRSPLLTSPCLCMQRILTTLYDGAERCPRNTIVFLGSLCVMIIKMTENQLHRPVRGHCGPKTFSSLSTRAHEAGVTIISF